MIQEQISTSSQRCLNGNAGFGIVAQTSGMAPHLARDAGALSGYSHLFSAGDVNNPTAFLHVIRRTGGVDRHILSRVADCGNDYTGRSNRIGHHWIVEEDDIRSLPGGPAAIASQHHLFCTSWKEKSQELPRGKQLQNPQVNAGICRTWQQRLGDAGWGGVVAERVEKGDPISIIFEPGMDVLPFLAEVFALLSPSVRWKATFSTYYMKSQEPPNSPKIQIKCIVAGSDEMAFARLTPNTLLIDLRRPPREQPSGKYVEFARTGVFTKPVISTPTQHIQAAQELELFLVHEEMEDVAETQIYDIAASPKAVPLVARYTPITKRPVPIAEPEMEPLPKKKSKRLFIGLGIGVLVFISLLVLVIMVRIKLRKDEIARITIVYAKHVESIFNEIKIIADTKIVEQQDLNRILTDADKAIKDAHEAKNIAVNAKKHSLKRVADAKTRADQAVWDAYNALDSANGAMEVANKLKAENDAISNAEAAIANIHKLEAEVNKVDGTLNDINANIVSDVVPQMIEDAREYLANIKKKKLEKTKEGAKAAWEKVKNLFGANADIVNTLAENLHTNEQNVNDLITKKYTALDNAKKGHEDAIAHAQKIKDAKNYLASLNKNNYWKDIKKKDKSEPMLMEGSKVLGAIKDHVTIAIEQFVALDGDSEKKPINQTHRSNQETVFHFGDNVDEMIIKFYINDDGLFYQWYPKTFGYWVASSDAHNDKLLSILMSKLRIEIEDVSEEIVLWQPVEYKIEDNGDLSPVDGYWVNPGDKATLLLEIEKCVLKAGGYPGQHSIEQVFVKKESENNEFISYSPKEIEIGRSKVSFQIVRDDFEVMKIKLNIDIAPEFKNSRKNVVKSINEDCKERHFATELNVDEPGNFWNDLKKEIDEAIKEQKQDQKDGKQTITSLNEWYKTCKMEYDDIQRNIKEEKAKWEKEGKKPISISDFTFTPFTIDLVKPDTNEDDVDKPENRLVLLYVPSPPSDNNNPPDE